MALTVGSRVGSFQILALVGVGGMGEVYKAHDTELNRDVALKVLPEAFARDPERMARFRREAQVLPVSLVHDQTGRSRDLCLFPGFNGDYAPDEL